MMKTFLPALLLTLAFSEGLPAKTIPNHAIANLVLGQKDFVTGGSPSQTSSFNLGTPSGVAIDPVTGKVFVVSYYSSRILRYPNASSLKNGAGAEAVFGQNKFSTGLRSSGDTGLSEPSGIYLDRHGRLWVADKENHRVLMFEAAVYRTDQPHADRVFGQPDFTTTTLRSTAATSMFSPYAVCVDVQDRLWVADSLNHRVLRFDTVSDKQNGAPADGVLGQSNFTTNALGIGSSGLKGTFGIAVSATGTLFVSDNGSQRILRFANAATLGNGAGATSVLGQADFNGSTSGTAANKLSRPTGIWLTPADTLWVSDRYNHRILRFDNASILPSGSTATGVVGQPNFTSNLIGTTNRSLTYPFTPFVDSTGSLWIPDFNNNRVLRFPPDVTRPELKVTSTVPKSTTSKTLTIKGTASDTYGISKVTYRVNSGSTKTATGTTSWQFKAALKDGNNTIIINSVDSVSNKSTSKVLKIVRN